ncbi:hypothetical protein JW935_18215 [candidate division KSB1 bacterium]|nr:hypothetical protein [candidate division KSB1 bacterium]
MQISKYSMIAFVFFLAFSGFYNCGEKEEIITNVEKKETVPDTTRTTVTKSDSIGIGELVPYSESVKDRLDTILAIIAQKEQSLLSREQKIQNREEKLAKLSDELNLKQKRAKRMSVVCWTLFIIGLLSALWTVVFIFFFRVSGIKKDKARYIVWAEKKLQRLESSINRLVEQTEKATGKVRENYQKRLDKVKKMQKDVVNQLENLKNTSGEAWHEFTEGVEKALETLKKGLRHDL